MPDLEFWTRHPPTSCTVRLSTSTGSSSTRSTTTMPSRWMTRSTLGQPPPGRQHGLREVRVVNARPTPTTTRSWGTVQTMLRLSGCARGWRGACGGEASGRAMTTRDWRRVGRAGFCLRLQARARGSRRKWSQVESVGLFLTSTINEILLLE
jgi:hypothetical protein